MVTMPERVYVHSRSLSLIYISCHVVKTAMNREPSEMQNPDDEILNAAIVQKRPVKSTIRLTVMP
jgi:hypothetical protein